MENSILISTKKILGLDEAYTVFDLDIIMHINAAFAVINQLGIGPSDGFFIENNTAVWDDLDLPPKQLGMVRTYVFLKARLLFDPPGTSYLLTAMDNQIKEYEWRLNASKEIEGQEDEWTPPSIGGDVILDGGIP